MPSVCVETEGGDDKKVFLRPSDSCPTYVSNDKEKVERVHFAPKSLPSSCGVFLRWRPEKIGGRAKKER